MEKKLKPVKAIHITLCLGVLLAYFFMGDLQTLDFLKIPDIASTGYVYIIFPVMAIFVGNLLYKKQLSNAPKELKLEEKVGIYQTALIMRWSLLEGVAFFILFATEELIIVGLLLILYMLYLRPSEEGMKRDFEVMGK